MGKKQIYLIVSGEYADYQVYSVVRTKRAAEKRVQKLNEEWESKGHISFSSDRAKIQPIDFYDE